MSLKGPPGRSSLVDAGLKGTNVVINTKERRSEMINSPSETQSDSKQESRQDEKALRSTLKIQNAKLQNQLLRYEKLFAKYCELKEAHEEALGQCNELKQAHEQTLSQCHELKKSEDWHKQELERKKRQNDLLMSRVNDLEDQCFETDQDQRTL